VPTKYQTGRRLEWEIKRIFEDVGWSIVRGAGSKGDFALDNDKFKADLIATKIVRKGKKEVWIVLLQAKRTNAQ